MSADGPASGSHDRCRAAHRFLAVVAALAFVLVVLSEGAAAQGSEATATQAQAAADGSGTDSAAAEPAPVPDSSPAPAEATPAEPATRSNAAAPEPEDQPASQAAVDTVDVEAPPSTGPVSPPAATVDAPHVTPDIEIPLTGEGGSPAGGLAESTAGSEVVLSSALGPAVSPEYPARGQLPYLKQTGSSTPARHRTHPARVVVGNAPPQLSRTSAAASAPAPLTLPAVSARARPGGKVVAVADEERAPLAPLESPGPPGPENTPQGGLCGGSSPCAGGSAASVLIMIAALACVCTLLFERLVVSSAAWRSESFTSLRERPG